MRHTFTQRRKIVGQRRRRAAFERPAPEGWVPNLGELVLLPDGAPAYSGRVVFYQRKGRWIQVECRKGARVEKYTCQVPDVRPAKEGRRGRGDEPAEAGSGAGPLDGAVQPPR